MKVTLVDLDVLLYKWFLMITGAVLTVLFFVCTIFCTFMGPGIGWGTLMFVSMLISIGVFYTGWDTGRNRPEEHESEGQEAAVQSIMKNHN